MSIARLIHKEGHVRVEHHPVERIITVKPTANPFTWFVYDETEAQEAIDKARELKGCFTL